MLHNRDADVANFQDGVVLQGGAQGADRREELCYAMEQVRKGQADDLGGGVFKKRLDKNRHRSIIVAKGRRYWFYTYSFAKKDRDNITDAELIAFPDLADLYDRKTDEEIALELKAQELTEICHARKA